VPVVLVGFGIGALGGTALGGRVGDRCPLATIAAAVSLTVVSLVVLACAASHAVIVVVLVVLLGASGLGTNPVLVAQTLRHASHGSTLGSSLATSAFNLGTATGSALAGAILSSSWGLVGPTTLGVILTGSALAPIALLAATPHDKPTTARPTVDAKTRYASPPP
jgi:predicted MFS family arabinose efflux permease